MRLLGSFIGCLLLGGCAYLPVRVQVERGAITPPQQGNYSQLVRVQPFTTTIIDSNGLTITKVVPIKYPKDYRFNSVKRDVMMIATVRRDGWVRRLRLVTGREIMEFATNVEVALIQWRFRPLPRELDIQVRVIFTPANDY